MQSTLNVLFQLGEWVFVASGTGLLPQAQDPVSVYTVAGSNTTLIIPFRNPMDHAVLCEVILRGKFTVITQGPVVQNAISLTSLLRVISLTVLADSIHNILILFAKKMLHCKSCSHFFQQKISAYLPVTPCKF